MASRSQKELSSSSRSEPILHRSGTRRKHRFQCWNRRVIPADPFADRTSASAELPPLIRRCPTAAVGREPSVDTIAPTVRNQHEFAFPGVGRERPEEPSYRTAAMQQFQNRGTTVGRGGRTAVSGQWPGRPERREGGLTAQFSGGA